MGTVCLRASGPPEVRAPCAFVFATTARGSRGEFASAAPRLLDEFAHFPRLLVVFLGARAPILPVVGLAGSPRTDSSACPSRLESARAHRTQAPFAAPPAHSQNGD